MATGYQGSFGPEAHSDPVASFLHWVAFGNRPGAGLAAVPGQFLHSVDPRSKAGIANLAGLFVGGPRGDATPMMDSLGMRGQFAPYHEAPVGPLERGLTHEGPIRPSRGYNPSIRGMVERAHTNPFIRASRGAPDDQLNQLSRIENLRQQAARSAVARRQLDEHLNSAPMSGKVEQPHTDLSAEGKGLRHPDTLNRVIHDALNAHMRNAQNLARYRSALGHNHLN